MRRRRPIVIAGIALFLAAALLFAFSGRFLWWLGSLLVNDEAPQKSDMVVVIGGDYTGNRILKAAELAREGYAPKVLVSGAGRVFDRHESDLAIDLAVAHGYPRDEFIAFHYAALSTTDEAAMDIAEMRRLGVHKYLLVTSVWHTARAGRIFRREGPGLEERTVGAPDPKWNGGRWWIDREGRKIWFMESVKTIADYLRI